jgi:hypothetical protein
MIVFTPLLGWPVLAGAGLCCLAALAFALWGQARGALWRGLGFLFLFGILAGPQWVQQTRRPLPDVAVLLVDRSQSMAVGSRAAMAAAARASLLAQAAKLPGLQLREAEVPPAASGGTAMFDTLRQALASVPAAQLAGVVAITDGEISDAPASDNLGAPLTALLTAKGEETDRELRLLATPAYGLAGKTVDLQFAVFDHGAAADGAAPQVTITEDGDQIWQGPAPVGQTMTVAVPVRHAGAAVVAVQVTPLPGEVSQVNDQAAFTLTGIAKKLEVLLISGNPNQSERSWRLLLKSDPAVELVHFTILRLPDELMDANIADLALVPFPVAQLFEADLAKFDLIILDEFNTAGLLPPPYLGNIAGRVKNGGALLVEVGPEYASVDSLALTPLASVLPVVPAPPGTVTQAFAPVVTALGARHPVTAPFSNQALAPWDRMETATPTAGDVLMTGGAENWPLLVLAGEGRGRVGMLLSDQFWLWTRGGAHDGPALPLLRRVVHWLLREPALEAESLSARIENGQLTVQRRTLAAANPGPASIILPDGSAQALALAQQAPGLYAGTIPASAPGVWQVTEGGITAYAAQNALNAAEYQDLAATALPLRPAARVIWLGQNPAQPLADMLQPRHATQVTGSRNVPLLPPFPAMCLALALLAAAWWRERGSSV